MPAVPSVLPSRSNRLSPEHANASTSSASIAVRNAGCANSGSLSAIVNTPGKRSITTLQSPAVPSTMPSTPLSQPLPNRRSGGGASSSLRSSRRAAFRRFLGGALVTVRLDRKHARQD
jgi:hypothetical protein